MQPHFNCLGAAACCRGRSVVVRVPPVVGSAPESVGLQGVLHIPEQCKLIVIFAHGSGSNRMSPRNKMVASELQTQGWFFGDVSTAVFGMHCNLQSSHDTLLMLLRPDFCLAFALLYNRPGHSAV
jgi:hypothetical protein